MSWLVGALQTAGSLVDTAGTISNIVYQQRQAAQLEKQNQLMEMWMNKQEALQKSQMELSRDLAVNGPALRVQAALDAGFDAVSARRMAGSGERVIWGNLDRPLMHAGTMDSIRNTKHLESISHSLATFKNGTPFGKSAPPQFKQGRPAATTAQIQLGPKPGSSSV
uniref:Structural protein n=1 Tax=Sapovirus Hu/Chiba/000496/2000 TaxID=255226 RepID=Q0E7Z6_9CALI|nr:structural protein [Sapovirus Hu/Chiba/000496/2000]